MPKRFALPAIVITLHCMASITAAMDAVAPAEVLTEPPTLHCLGFRWLGSGDENRNANVQVHYRGEGEQQWKRALDLLRINGLEIFRVSKDG